MTSHYGKGGACAYTSPLQSKGQVRNEASIAQVLVRELVKEKMAVDVYNNSHTVEVDVVCEGQPKMSSLKEMSSFQG